MSPGLVLSLDTATSSATVALVGGSELLGQRRSGAGAVLAGADALLREAGLAPSALEGLVVGTGPGSFTGLRVGFAAVRGLALALDLPVAGVSTLAALAEAAPGALPVIDARRREVFTLVAGEPAAVAPDELAFDPGTLCVGDGALRYRAELEAAGGVVPPELEAHVPWAARHALLADGFGPAELVEPVYVRPPDAVARAGTAA